MKPLLSSVLMVLLVLARSLAAEYDQGSHDPRLKGFKTPEGFKLEIVAQAPVVINPIALTFATDGTPYVLEWRPDAQANVSEVLETVTYKDGSTRKVARLKKRTRDVVKTLADTTGKGTYDQATVILEDELPAGILLHDGWLYLSGRGTVRRFKQKEPGGAYDIKEVIAQGFGGLSRQQVLGMTLGPDGFLYLTSGGDNYVEGSDGSRATVLRTGAIFRFRPDGSKMTPFAQGFCDPGRDGVFNAAGNLFQADREAKGPGCRLRSVSEGVDFGCRLPPPPPPPPPPQGGESQSPVPFASGLMIYNDTCFPEKYRGLLFYPDAWGQRIRACRVERDGAGFAVVEEFNLLTSDDPRFRPVQMVLGPDGAMYIVDFGCRPEDAGPLWGDGKGGRIYRLSWTGTADEPALPLRGMDSWARITRLEDGALLKVLSNDNAGDRAVAMTELRRRGDKNRPALLQLLEDGEQPSQARFAALGVLYSFWSTEVQKACDELLSRGDADLRRQAAEALGWNTPPGERNVAAHLFQAMADPDHAVRRAAALALARVSRAAAADGLANTLAFDDGKDPFLTEGYVRAIESLGQPGIERLVALADSGVKKDLDRVVEVFLVLRTRPAAEALPTLLRNPHLSISQRARLISSYSNYLLDPPLSLEPCLDYLRRNPEPTEVKRAGLAVLSSSAILRGEKGSAWVLSLMAEGQNQQLRQEAVQALAATPDGARLAATLFLDGKLPRDLLPQLTEALRRQAGKDPRLDQLREEVIKKGK